MEYDRPKEPVESPIHSVEEKDLLYAGFGFKAKNFEMLSEQHSK